MFSKVFSAGAIALSFLNQECMSDKAVAWFTNENGINGSVCVDNGTLTIDLDVSGLAANNFSGVTDGAECFTGGLKYHIHEYWLHNTSSDQLGLTMCGSGYTGGHWDPWIACGSASGNDYCAAAVDGCVWGSSALGDDGYDCSTSTFAENAYACEVGDWNGKYGLLDMDDATYKLSMSGSSSYEADGGDIIGMSVVFHCNGGDRAFCAEFTDGGDGEVSRDGQEDTQLTGAWFEDTNSTVIFRPDGWTLALVYAQLLTIPSDCGDTLEIRVYDDWSASGASSSEDCDDYVGSFYDPTVSCAPGSDSEFCGDNGQICNSSYSYTCDFSSDTDRYLCAPGDLTGKHGSLSSTDFGFFNVVDELMIDLQLLEGKSIVIQCSDTWEIVACAGIYNNMTAPDSDSDSGDMHNTTVAGNNMTSAVMDDDDSAFASGPIQFGTIVMLLVTGARALF